MKFLVENEIRTKSVDVVDKIYINKITAIRGDILIDEEKLEYKEVIIEPDEKGFMCMGRVKYGILDDCEIYGKSYYTLKSIPIDDITEIRIGNTWISCEHLYIQPHFDDDFTDKFDIIVEVMDNRLLRQEKIEKLNGL